VGGICIKKGEKAKSSGLVATGRREKSVRDVGHKRLQSPVKLQELQSVTTKAKIGKENLHNSEQ